MADARAHLRGRIPMNDPKSAAPCRYPSRHESSTCFTGLSSASIPSVDWTRLRADLQATIGGKCIAVGLRDPAKAGRRARGQAGTATNLAEVSRFRGRA